MSEELETLNRIDRIQKSFEELTNSATRLNEIVKEKQEEIERLNNIINNDDVYGYIKHLEDLTAKKDNIINKLEKEIKFQRKMSLSLNAYGVSVCDRILYRLQQLKGEDKE